MKKLGFAFVALTVATLFARGIEAQSFPGTGTGAIADGASPCPAYGTPLVVSFAVSGLSTNVSTVEMVLDMDHTWIGDLDVVLAAPGGSPSLPLFSRIGATTATGLGSSSNFTAATSYDFVDTSSTNIWSVVNGQTSTFNVPAGTYLTTQAGGAGQVNPAPATSLNTTFGGLTPAQANGTWTLTARDGCSGDTGHINAATLTITQTVPVELQRFRAQ